MQIIILPYNIILVQLVIIRISNRFSVYIFFEQCASLIHLLSETWLDRQGNAGTVLRIANGIVSGFMST